MQIEIQKNEMQAEIDLFWLTCVVHYKWWLSTVITHSPDIAQNSNYLSIRYHIFTRNHNVLSVFKKTKKTCLFTILRTFWQSIHFLPKVIVVDYSRDRISSLLCKLRWILSGGGLILHKHIRQCNTNARDKPKHLRYARVHKLLKNAGKVHGRI